jgi:phosphoribosylaminoimidazole-succinocarboxamide synthase
LPTLIATEFEDLQLYARGKVRDLYAVGDLLLLVATDRISASTMCWQPASPARAAF